MARRLAVWACVAVVALGPRPIAAASRGHGHGRQGTIRAEELHAEEYEGGGGAAHLRTLCLRTRGSWCWRYHKQPEVGGRKQAYVASEEKQCQNDCSGVGNCNYQLGVCDCPAGFRGEDCSVPDPRPCTNRHAGEGEDHPVSHMDENGRDRNASAEGWTASRCGGICDAELGACWCDGDKYGFKTRPAGAAYGSRAHIIGSRPLIDAHQPSTDSDGKKRPWGTVRWEFVFGATGWCNGSQPYPVYNCGYDGLSGDLCKEATEMYCANQCTGRGLCYYGFCKCDKGWYGTDCSRPTKKAASKASQEPPALEAQPHLREVLVLPPALHTPSQARKRPLIYVYDLEPMFNTRILQYRMGKTLCTWRHWQSENASSTNEWMYGVEQLMHEQLLQSPHRTFDPKEADFFYVPVYSSCYAWPVFAYADMPFFAAPMGPRVGQMAMMNLQAKRWIQQNFPYWNRTDGADHIWLFSHDEGACWAPTEIYNTSIILTHWGRLDLNHTSNTAYPPDNYTVEHKHPRLQPKGWLQHIKHHACYDPAKDLVIPSYKPPRHYISSPLMNSPAKERTTLAFFRGDMGLRREKWYSRGIRQRLHDVSKAEDWWGKHRIALIATGVRHPLQGGYSELLASSVFCLVMPGDGWSGRAVDAVLHGCVPVVIQDEVHADFESILDWDSFSLRVPEAMVEHLPIILKSVAPDRLARLQRNLQHVWHRFAWVNHPLLKKEIQELKGRSHLQGFQPSGPAAELSSWAQEDALGTIMQWLHSKIGRGREQASAGPPSRTS